jgi:hypothetical protein
MTAFGEWLKRVPPLRAAIGFLILLFTAAFSLGAASANMFELPPRMAEQEAVSARHDTIIGETLVRLERHIYQDSIATARIYWILCLMAEQDGPVNPLDCEPGGSE